MVLQGQSPIAAKRRDTPTSQRTPGTPHSCPHAVLPAQAAALGSGGGQGQPGPTPNATSPVPQATPRPRGSPRNAESPSRLLDIGVRGAAAQLQHRVVILPHGRRCRVAMDTASEVRAALPVSPRAGHNGSCSFSRALLDSAPPRPPYLFFMVWGFFP